MNTESNTQSSSIVSEIFAQFRTAARTHNSSDLLKAAGIKYPYEGDRMMYLAYGFIRGKAYRTMEPTARPLFDKMGHSETTFLKGLAALITYGGMAVTPEELKGWMAIPETDTHREKRAAKEALSQAVRAAKREAHRVPVAIAAVA